MNAHRIAAIALLPVLICLAPPLAAQSADVREADTMVVVDRDTLPEDIVNVIRLPAPAGDVGRQPSDAARRESGPGMAAEARGAAAELAEAARASGAETAREARERAAEIAETMREAARDAREERRGPPPELEIDRPIDPPNRP